MDTKCARRFALIAVLATAMLGAFSTQALAVKPNLATSGPKVQGGLKVGKKNTVRSQIYNEQQLGFLKKATKIKIKLTVTDPKGKETDYYTTTRNSTFAGGNPPVKESVRWSDVKIPHAGKYILTVTIPKNNKRYGLSKKKASVSKSYAAGGGNGKQPPQSSAGYDLIVKLKEKGGTRGAGYWVYVKTPKGKQIGKKRTGGNAQVTFKKVAPLKAPYRIEVKAGNKIVAKLKHKMPKKDDLLSIDLKKKK